MVSVLIPFTSTDPHRLANLHTIRGRYHDLGWEVILGHCDGPWIKAHAVADAAAHATHDLYVVADGDCWTDNTPDAVRAVHYGAPWASPHTHVQRLTADGHREQLHQAVRGGGIVVLTRTTWQQIPLDPRFVGWGHEDHSWGLALDRLAGPCARGDATLTHLWHPPQERITRRIGSHAGRQLERRYWTARNDHDAMVELVDEAKEALWTRLAS
jgi:hypothetical protein